MILWNGKIPRNIKYINDLLYYRYFNTSEFHEELTKMVFNPIRLEKIAEKYNIEFMELVDLY